MVVKQRKKNTRLKGTRNWGWGRMHRGSGNRGGAGNAGTGKKAHCKKPSVWGTDYFGKHGFKSKGQIFDEKPVNIFQIEDCFESWQKKGIIQKKDDKFLVELDKAGYNKLLSTGNPTKKYLVKVERASEGAIEKIKKSGGDVELFKPKKISAKKPESKSKETKSGSNSSKAESKEIKPAKSELKQVKEAKTESDKAVKNNPANPAKQAQA